MDGRFEGNSLLVDLEIISPLINTAKKVYSFGVDTGFTDHICLTYQEAFPLALTLVGIEEYTIADGSRVQFFSCFGLVSFDGKPILSPISIRPNGSRLIGIGLMKKLGIKLEADFVNQTVKLVKVPMSQPKPLSKNIPTQLP